MEESQSVGVTFFGLKNNDICRQYSAHLEQPTLPYLYKKHFSILQYFLISCQKNYYFLNQNLNMRILKKKDFEISPQINTITSEFYKKTFGYARGKSKMIQRHEGCQLLLTSSLSCVRVVCGQMLRLELLLTCFQNIDLLFGKHW